MTRILLLLSTLFLVSSGVLGQVPGADELPQRYNLSLPSTWRQYTVKGEEFSVALPSLPAMTTNAVLYPRVQKYRVERHLTTLLDGVVYSIDVFENPKPRQSLEDFVSEQHAASKYDLSIERNLTNGDFPGKEYSSSDKTQPATVQFFATDRRLYRFAANGSIAGSAGVKQFFSSIVLGKTPNDAENVPEGPGIPLVLDTGERVFKGKEVDTKVRITWKPEPQFTEEARHEQTSGTVILLAVFSKTGEVTNIQAVAVLPNGLTERAINAAKGIRFIPATKDGNPVSIWIQLEYNFNL